MSKTVVGLFHDYKEAEAVVHDLVRAGFPHSDISVIASDQHGQYNTRHDDGGPLSTGAGTGAALGGIAGLLLGLAALAIPGVGPIIAAGPLAAALTGAGIGAATGGFLGALSHMGVPEDEANFYAEGIRRGGALVTLLAKDHADAERAVDILDRHDAVDVEEANAKPSAIASLPKPSHAPCDLHSPEFRDHFRKFIDGTGYTFDQACSAYRYGQTLGGDGRFAKYEWNALESQIRHHWDSNNPGTWDLFAPAVRFSFDRARMPVAAV